MEIKLSKEFDYRVQQGDDLLSICEKFGTSKDNIIRNNANIPFYAGEWITVKVNDFKTHIVKPAETLRDIAKTYGVKGDKIQKDNNLNDEKLFIGQVLKIYE